MIDLAQSAERQAAARRAVEAIERQARERTDAGLPRDGLPDLSAEGERDGFYQAQLIRELAVRHITSWTGVEQRSQLRSRGALGVAARDRARPDRGIVSRPRLARLSFSRPTGLRWLIDCDRCNR